MRIMRSREAAPGYQNVFKLLRQQCSIGDADAFPIRQIFPARSVVDAMLLNRRAAQSDLIVKLPCVQNIFSGKHVVADHSPRFPYADLCTEGSKVGLLVSG